MKIKVKNEVGNVKEIKIGFSWTVFFFGFFVPFIRGDFKWGLIMLGISIVLSVIGMPFVAPLVGLVFSFLYNKLYARDLFDKGYRGMSAEDDEILKKTIMD